MRLSERLSGWLRAPWGPQDTTPEETAGPCTHVILLDGTMTSLTPGEETNVGRIYHLLRAQGGYSLYYEPGIQWRGWARAHEVAAGVGINRQIRRAYAFLARRYSPGDRIFLVGYSRGAYGVRALAGLIDRLGLLRADVASPARVDEIYAHYREDPTSPTARAFVARHCHGEVPIEAVCVFDTVRALGNRWPLLWRLAPRVHAFRSNHLGRSVRAGFHALALHETRRAFAPEMWEVPAHRHAHVQQVWFRGSHGLVGGQVREDAEARQVANIPLVWMLDRMASRGLKLPPHWQNRFPRDPEATSPWGYRGTGRLFLARKGRVVGADASEWLHPSVGTAVPRHVPKDMRWWSQDTPQGAISPPKPA